ncbi:MAG: radical SAM protein [Candidatus Micrarchaeota archaeon]|nr:radical SAM protein [Candidatus Micrarchaeota archaeon]
MNLKFTSILANARDEYPPYSTDVVYLAGCPLRCGFCNVPDLLYTKTAEERSVAELAAYFIKKNSQAISLKGGEPSAQANALLELFRHLKGEGVRTKMETAGYYPEGIRALLPYLDYIAIDVKAKLDEKSYAEATGGKSDLALMQLFKTLAFVETTEYPVFREMRMTIVPGLNDSAEAVQDVAMYVRKYCDLFVLQQFHPQGPLVNKAFEQKPETTTQTLTDLAMVARNLIPEVAVRTNDELKFIK